MTILVVGDNPGLLVAYTRAFSSAGHLVVPAHSGPSAEHACSVVTYDMIVITAALPANERNGLAERLREKQSTTRIICAGRCPESFAKTCLEGSDISISSERPEEVVKFVDLMEKGPGPQ